MKSPVRAPRQGRRGRDASPRRPHARQTPIPQGLSPTVAPRSNASLGHIHHAAITNTDNAIDMVGTRALMRPRHNNTAASIANTINPVLEYVVASITQSATPAIRPAHRHPPPHPQQNGNNAQIAAAAWFGFAKPNPCRTRSPTMKSTTHQPSAALDGLHHLLSYKCGLRTSIVAHLKNSLFHIATCLPLSRHYPTALSFPMKTSSHSTYNKHIIRTITTQHVVLII